MDCAPTILIACLLGRLRKGLLGTLCLRTSGSWLLSSFVYVERTIQAGCLLSSSIFLWSDHATSRATPVGWRGPRSATANTSTTSTLARSSSFWRRRDSISCFASNNRFFMLSPWLNGSHSLL